MSELQILIKLSSGETYTLATSRIVSLDDIVKMTDMQVEHFIAVIRNSSELGIRCAINSIKEHHLTNK